MTHRPYNIAPPIATEGSETDIDSPSTSSSIRRDSGSESPGNNPRNLESPLSRSMSDSESPRRRDHHDGEDVHVKQRRRIDNNSERFDGLMNLSTVAGRERRHSDSNLSEEFNFGALPSQDKTDDTVDQLPLFDEPGFDSDAINFAKPPSALDTFRNTSDVENEPPLVSDNSYLYRVDSFPSLIHAAGERIVSETFDLAGFQWQVLFFPAGNNVNKFTSPSHVAMFVQLMNPEKYPLTIQHKFTFTLLPPPGSVLKPHERSSSHRFSATENDRGFVEFVSILQALKYVHPPNNSLFIKVELEKSKYSFSSSLWPDNSYDSKAVTGFVGLKNQGATCYMNSLLQTLFHLPPFRQLIYSLPTDDEQSSRVPLSLQRVFYNLQTSEFAPSTKHLTSAFGWNSLEAFMQHDVQEFSRVLLDNLDEQLKKTPLEGKVEQMFAGKVEMFIECVNVPFKSQRTETYFDLALNVKGCQTLAKSFEQYCEVEMLDGDNQYRAEKHGLQDARKGVRFLSFPPVLQLQLKRFEYNFERDMNVKLNDRFEFPLTIDLSHYLSDAVEPAPSSDPHVYHLHSVLVHSGSGHGGHYYSFIRPFFSKLEYSKSPWFKFDDEHVTTATTEEATVGNYGGETRAGYYPISRMSMANAYMLVYVRQRVTQEITQVVPDRLRTIKESGMTNGKIHTINDPVVRAEGEVSLPDRAELHSAFLAHDPHQNGLSVESKSAVDDVSMPELSPPSDSEDADDEKMPPLLDDIKSPDNTTDDDIDPLSLTHIDVPLPESLLQQFKREEEALRIKRERIAREHLYTDLTLYSDQNLVRESMNGLGVGWELHTLHAPPDQTEGGVLDIGDSQIRAVISCHKVKALRTQTINQASETPKADGPNQGFEWDELISIPHDRQQYWLVKQSLSHALRPAELLLDSSKTIEQMREGVFVRDAALDVDPEILELTGNMTENLTAGCLLQGHAHQDRALILCKVFDVVTQRSVYLGSVIVPLQMPFANVERLFRLLMKKHGFALSSIPNQILHEVNAQSDNDQPMQEDSVTGLIFSEERNGTSSYDFDVEDLDPQSGTVGQAGFRTGDIIVGQLDVSDAVILALSTYWTKKHQSISAVAPPFQPTYTTYLHYLQNRVLVELRVMLHGILGRVSTTKRVELMNNFILEQVTEVVASCLSLDPSRVVLHKRHPVNEGQPDDKPIAETWQYRTSPMRTLSSFLESNDPVLYVNVQEYSAAQLRDHTPARLVYIRKDGEAHSFKTLIPRLGCIRDVVRAARRYLSENQLVNDFTTSEEDVFVFQDSLSTLMFSEASLDDPISNFMSLRTSTLPPEIIVEEMYEGLAEAKKHSNDQTFSDDPVDPNAPVLLMVSHCTITSGNVPRAYSHCFSIVVLPDATPSMVMDAIFKRVRMDDPEHRSQCKLMVLSLHGRGHHVDLQSDEPIAQNMKAEDRLGFYDPVHLREWQAKAKALVAEKTYVPPLSRYNAPIKFYQ